MLYLFDANVFITAHSLYYPVNSVPEFWSWLAHKGTGNELKVPLEIFEEIKDGGTDEEKDLLFGWITEPEVKSAILLDEEIDPELVNRVLNDGYATDLKDDEIEQIGRDPFLVAYALVNPAERCVVTTEVSKPKRLRHKRHLPDVCKSLGVQCCDTFAMLKALKFSTGWKP